LKTNEENACKAFIKILEEIKGVTYEIESLPEEENSNTQDVEAILAPKEKEEDAQSPRIAVEHTIVEAHEKQKYYVHQLDGIEKGISQRCQGKLPTDYCFSLSAPPSLIAGMNKKRRDRFVEEISGWVTNVANSLTKDQQSSRLYNEHEVTLWCVGPCSGLNGTVGMTSTRPGNVNKERQDRFRRAIKEKIPKLIKYKEKGYATALLLEDVSAVYTNPRDNLKYVISHQYHSEFGSKIDYIVIFVSQRKKMFLGLVWKEESLLYLEIPENRIFSFQQ
jgi:hypothetical protein